nr:MAG TPA: hypothetical protein [Caudoviricetes sp.]DAW51673.1 MAG TPA: hypothetical protein [Caudoviricetes sp.]
MLFLFIANFLIFVNITAFTSGASYNKYGK